MRTTSLNRRFKLFAYVCVRLLVVQFLIAIRLATAQDIAEPQLPSITDQHGVQLNSGSISIRYNDGRIGPPRHELSRLRTRSDNGFTSTSNKTPRDNLLDFQVHYSDEAGMFSVSAEEISDRFEYNEQTMQFEPADATVSTLDNVAGNDDFTDLVYTGSNGTVYTYEALVDYNFLRLYEITAEMALLKKIEYPDGEIWTNNDGVNPARYGVRSNNLGYTSYPHLKNLGYMPASGQYIQNDWPGAHHQNHPTYVRGQVVTGTFHYGNGDTAPFPLRNRDATITYASGDTIKANFLIQTASNGWPEDPRVESIERYGSTWTYSYTENGSDEVTSTTVTAPSGTKEKYYFHTDEILSGKIYKYELIPSGGGTNLTTEYDYLSGRLHRVTYPEGDKTEMMHDSSGRVFEVRKIAKPGSSLADIVVSYTYDTCTSSNRKYCGSPRTYTDERGNITKYSYSATHGGITEVQLPYVPGEGYHKIVTEYGLFNAWYKPSSQGSTQIKDNRAVWRKTKELACIVAAESAACLDGSVDVVVTEYHYEQGNSSTPSNVNLVQTITRSGDSSVSSATSYEYDTWGRVISEDGPLSGASDKIWREYDNRNNVTRETKADPDGGGPQRYGYERREYNLNDQVTLVETGWTTNENPSTRVDTVLLSTVYAHDGYGRREEVLARDKNGGAVSLTQTSFDSSGRVDCESLRMDVSTYAGSLPSSACTQTSSSDPIDRITKTHYDVYGRAYKTSFGLGTSVEMSEEQSLTNNGLQKTVKDGNGNVTTYMYDGLDRLYEVRFPNKTGGGSSSTDKVSAAYLVSNGNSTLLAQFGRMRSHLQGVAAEVELDYDERGRVKLADTTGTSNDVTTTFDEFGNIETLTRNGKAITYDWDALRRLKSETTTISGQSFTVSYLYDSAGRRTRMTYPDGFYVTYEYWGSGGLKYIKENGSSIIATYEYDAYGRGNKITFGNGVYREFDFDVANRVSDLDFTVPSDSSYNQQIDYGFNVANQITSKVVQNNVYLPTSYGNSSDYSVNGLNQVTDETADGSTLSLAYDKNGNLASDGVTTFVYDIFNRLTSATGGISFNYDASGRLYSIASSSTDTYFLYDGTALIGEYSLNGSASLQRRYIHGPGVDAPIVWYEGSAVSNATRRYLVQDDQGSVVLVTDSSGAELSHNTYDEYGVPGVSNGGRFQFTGQTWLEEAGLYYYKARMYNPYLGRFQQPDPIGYSDGLNLYAYVGNDPLNLIDPSGLSSNDCGPEDQAFDCLPKSPNKDGEEEEDDDGKAQQEIDEIIVRGKRIKKTRVVWTGTVNSVDAGAFNLGAATYWFKLRSNCVQGDQWQVEVKGTVKGVSYSPIPAGVSLAPKVTFYDRWEVPAPSNLVRTGGNNFSVMSGGLASPGGGVSATVFGMGDAFGFSHGNTFGADLDLDLMDGTATIQSETYIPGCSANR